MNKKVWSGFIAVFIVMEILEYLVNVVILSSTYMALASLWRPDMMSKMWIFHVIYLIVSFMLSFLFSKGYEGKGMGEGLRYGFYMGVLLSVPMAYGSYAMIAIPYSLALQWFIYGMVEYIIAGLVLAWIFGMKPKQTPTATS